MPTFNGHLASFTDIMAGNSSVVVNVDPAVPQKWFKQGIMAIRTIDGISGALGVRIIGSIGGATFVIAGRTAITTVGNAVIGVTAINTFTTSYGFPRPMKVLFEGTGAAAAKAGFTASVYMAGEY